MSDTSAIGFPEAARRLGVSVRLLRHAIRTKKIDAPAKLTATAALSPEWVAGVKAAAKASPSIFNGAFAQKVPAFARYQGTSAWRKYRVRVRGYARFKAA